MIRVLETGPAYQRAQLIAEVLHETRIRGDVDAFGFAYLRPGQMIMARQHASRGVHRLASVLAHLLESGMLIEEAAD